MKLATRLILYIAVSSVVPLAVLGTGAATVASNRVLEKTADLQGRTAEAIAVHVDTWLDLQLELVRQQTRALPVEHLSPEARAGVPALLLGQTPAARLVVLLDADGGLSGAPAAAPEAAPDQSVRALFRALAETRPDAVQHGLRVSSAYRVPPSRVPSLALEAPTDSAFRVGVELALDPIAERIGLEHETDVQVAILDPSGAVVLGGGSLVDTTAIVGLLGGTAVDVRYQTGAGTDVVAALAPVGSVGWTVLVAEPVEQSARALHEIRLRTAYIAFVALILSLVVGALFARQLAGRVEELTDAALKVADGDYGRSVPPSDGSDEIADLTRAFNHMSGRLRADADRISRQNDEIAAFNQELQERVEERTRELRAARDKLVQSARLAAVGEMGAGLAHELNNPVAGILGLSQVLLARAGDGPQAALLRNIETQARRCREILSHLLGLSHDASHGPIESESVELLALFEDTLPLLRGPLRLRGVMVVIEPGPPLWVDGPRSELGRAIAQVVSSIRAAATHGGTLTVSGEPGDTITLRLHLVGPTIDVGSDDWNAAGMGLWAARRVFSDLGGRLHDPTDAASGVAEWRIVLPRAKKEA